MVRHINVKGKSGASTISGPGANASLSEEVDIYYSDVREHSFFESISISPCLKMIVANHEQSQRLRMDYEVEHAPISFSYVLSQRVRCTMTHGSRGRQVAERSPGDGVLAYLPQTRGTIDISPDKRVMGVSLHFCAHSFHELFHEVPQYLGRLGLSCHGAPLGQRFYQQSRFNNETWLVLKQILQCPYEGEIRRLFFEAKCYELVALKLAELGRDGRAGATDLSRRDMDRVREAHHILMTRLDHPPSLVDLSRQVGINRNKLNRGFKELFGNTVFNVLRRARLAKAWSLLHQTELSLAEIALTVGYNHQANFTTAFRRQFGKTPKTVRREVTGKPLPPEAMSC